MGQDLCQERPLSQDFDLQQQNQSKVGPPNIKVQPAEKPISDQPHLLFATRLDNTNFLLPAKVEQRLTQLKSFVYPDGPDVPKGSTLLNSYMLHNGAIYAGEWKGGKMHGKGFFVLPDKSILTCIVKDNVICRRGRIIYPNGDYFEGEVSNNKANGKGKLVEGKVTYIGAFKDNVPHGKGVETGEGYSFEGQFEAGQKKYGTLTWIRDGQTLTYKGEFYNNLFHGRGILNTNDGRYSGYFQKGQKQGLGKFYYNNKRYYEGEFKNDKRHGDGKIVDDQNNQIITYGRWQDDIFVE